VIVVSYDARPGRATALAARFAAACAVAFPGSPLPRAVVTGAPVRDEVLAVDAERDRAAARAALDLPVDRSVVLVVGGSLGSGTLNGAGAALMKRWRARRDLAIRHVVGERYSDAALAAQDGSDGIVYQPVRYEHRMALAYAAADVVIARAGATTVAELAVVGVPCVLIPWPGAAEDHQTANARVLADAGAAVLLPEAELTDERLANELEALLNDPARRAEMATAARTVGRRDAAAAVAALIEEHAEP
jgi:UDP-N-acetylglucosamine:LPS N-acetylglucosamine transferase